MSAIAPRAAPAPAPAALRPPVWLIVATGLLAVGGVALAVAETNLWLHYVIDAGESLSLFGLAFILIAGLHLYRRGGLLVSLPLAAPWLLFPVITQGDQIIDHLSINWMRLITHVLLGALFAMPVAVVVLAVRHVAAGPDGRPRRSLAWIPGVRLMAEGRAREGSAVLAAFLFVLQTWVAVRFLGELMVLTLIVLAGAVLWHGVSRPPARRPRAPQYGERFALAVLLAGVVASAGLFAGFKHRPGAYQGSPSHFMDPSQPDAGYAFDRVAVPAGPPALPADPAVIGRALTAYGQAFDALLAGYYILDRNYNYDFHNRLFLRSTPLLPGYRGAGLAQIADAAAIREQADAAAADALASLPPGDALAALLDDLRGYAGFAFARAALLERMSAEFERTEAGLQHATHIYEGEGKFLGVQLAQLLDKHAAVVDDPALASVVSAFVARSQAVHDRYATRIVGF